MLAYVNGEPGGSRVTPLLEGAAISAVNLAEVATKMLDNGKTWALIHEPITQMGFVVISFDQDQAHEAAKLRSGTRAYGLSMADRACIGLGVRLGLPVYTAERVWARLDVGATIVVIR